MIFLDGRSQGRPTAAAGIECDLCIGDEKVPFKASFVRELSVVRLGLQGNMRVLHQKYTAGSSSAFPQK